MKKIKKFSYEIIIVIIGILIVIGTVVVLNLERFHLMTKGYNFSEQDIILKLDDEEVERFLKSDRVVDIASWNKISNNNHYLEYEIYQGYKKDLSAKEVVEYIDEFYQNYYKSLKKLKYNYNQVINLMSFASLEDFKILIDNELTYTAIKPYLNIKGMIFKDLPKYIESNQEPITAVLSQTYPFINAKNKPTKEYQILQPENTLTLIKKGFIVSKDYEPKDLVIPNIPIAQDTENKKLRKDAARALEKMYQDALKENYQLVLNSGYRSYESQTDIYDEYFKKYDEITAAGLVAKPGSSEHQLGLGVDLTSQSVIDKKKLVFGDTDEYKWVVKNAHKYGFILRYPKDRSSLTGTANEPWHFRYVGKKAAKIIHDNNWTLEDYILKYGFSYDLKEIK
ncbi:M15 family metallopeptidase [Thomasclavelia sp.]